VRARHDGVSLDCDKGAALDHPRINDELTRLAFELTHHCVDGYGDAGNDGRDMSIDKLGGLLAVMLFERAHLDRHANLLDF